MDCRWEAGIYPQEGPSPQGPLLSLRVWALGLTQLPAQPRWPTAAQTSEFEAAGPPGQAQSCGSGGHSVPRGLSLPPACSSQGC